MNCLDHSALNSARFAVRPGKTEFIVDLYKLFGEYIDAARPVG